MNTFGRESSSSSSFQKQTKEKLLNFRQRDALDVPTKVFEYFGHIFFAGVTHRLKLCKEERVSKNTWKWFFASVVLKFSGRRDQDRLGK